MFEGTEIRLPDWRRMSDARRMARLEMKRAAPTRVLSPTPLLTSVLSFAAKVSKTAQLTTVYQSLYLSNPPSAPGVSLAGPVVAAEES